MKHLSFYSVFFLAALFSCQTQQQGSEFLFETTSQGVTLTENGNPVFFYQKEPKSLDGKYVCNNYLHPLYNLKGEVITEEFPADHPYHRGIFWAWHQIYVDSTSVGDGWIMENIEQDVVNVNTSTDKETARLKVDVNWKSPNYENGKPFVSEQTTITIHPRQENMQKIDFAIALKALVPGVEIGGSDDPKGYGGLCTRVILPGDITFTSEKGRVEPQNEAIFAGPWMDISGTFYENSEKNGIAILCHPETENYPASWILRSKTSMQNIVFPGRDRILLPTNEPVILYYRLIIHNGDAGSIDLGKLQEEYEATDVARP